MAANTRCLDLEVRSQAYEEERYVRSDECGRCVLQLQLRFPWYRHAGPQRRASAEQRHSYRRYVFDHAIHRARLPLGICVWKGTTAALFGKLRPCVARLSKRLYPGCAVPKLSDDYGDRIRNTGGRRGLERTTRL